MTVRSTKSEAGTVVFLIVVILFLLYV